MFSKTRPSSFHPMGPACTQRRALASCAPKYGNQHDVKNLGSSGLKGFGGSLPLPSRRRITTRSVGPKRVCAVATEGSPSLEALKSLSYSKQYDEVFKFPLNPRQALPKPSKEAQAVEPEGTKVLLSDVVATGKRNLFFGRDYNTKDIIYVSVMIALHGLALCAPFTFSWPMVGLFFGTYIVTGLFGITLSYHRQLSHRSFTTPKWLEYVFAYCGVMAGQGDPMEWVSAHRYHHVHTDTPMDPHSPFEGFWWSHMGWLLDNQVTLSRVGEASNNTDLDQPFYRFIQKTYPLHMIGMLAALFALGGFPALVWGGALRLVWVYHITWFVNSASHVWGNQAYNTGDLSRNNWWVGILAFGEGWHNNHHAFEFSARHGLEWWQADATWGVICLLEKLGLAKDVKLPSEKQKARLALSR